MSVADVYSLVNNLKSVGDNDTLNAALDSAQQVQQKVAQNPITQWVRNIPRNVTVGLMDAAVNTVDAAHDFTQAAAKNFTRPNAADEVANEQEGLTAEGKSPEELRMDFMKEDGTPTLYGHARSAFLNLRDEMASGSNTADKVTQGAAQFMIPFLGWSKLFGATKVLSMARLAAESATSATAFSPHSGRMADLMSLAQHSEGKLADVMNTIAPDGSLLNNYIDYMTNRDDESNVSGRFKNVVDNLGLTAAVAGALKTGATALKVGFKLPGYIAENAFAGPGTRAAQAGKIVFHGTPHDFSEFDSSKIGTGEGSQTFGHGLYFAENPETAKYYRRMLTKSASEFGSNPNPNAGALMHVDIPDEHIANMIDWDRPISEQPALQKAISDLDTKVVPKGDRFQIMVNGRPGHQYLTRQAAEAETTILQGRQHDMDARHAYLALSEALGSDKAASEYLASKGIPGIKYLDQGSRGAGSGSRNVVLFDVRHAKIVAKNGVPVPQRPALQQNSDPAEALLAEQARQDAENAARNPGAKRPPLRQGHDPAQAIFEAQARHDAERH